MPEFHLDGRVELQKARLLHHGQRLGVVQLHPVRIVLLLLDLIQVKAETVAELAELRPPLVALAERVRTPSDLVIQVLHLQEEDEATSFFRLDLHFVRLGKKSSSLTNLSVVPKQLETVAVGIPEEAKPRRQHGSVHSVLRCRRRHRRQQQTKRHRKKCYDRIY